MPRRADPLHADPLHGDATPAHASSLAERIATLELQLQRRPACRLATIVDLGTDDATLTLPLQVTIEDYEDEVIASWPEVGADGDGASEGEAILALKQDLTSLAVDLLTSPNDELGPLPLAQKRALEKAVTLRGRSSVQDP